MLLLVYRSIVTDAPRCWSWWSSSSAAARGVVAFLGYHDIIGLSTFATNLLVTAGDRRGDRLRDLPDRPISGGPRRGRGPRSRLLHDVPRHRARGPGLGPDDRRRDVLPAASPGCRTSRPWASRCAIGMVVAVARGADAGPGGHHRRQPVRAASNPSARCGSRGWRRDRHRGRPLARADPGRDDRAGAGRPARPCRATRPATTTATTCPPTCPANVGLRRRRTALLRRPG